MREQDKTQNLAYRTPEENIRELEGHQVEVDIENEGIKRIQL
jgi:hypothetical protein